MSKQSGTPDQRMLSGAMHYFRVLPQQWPHRLGMLRALGLNTVETYVPWNLHEPRPGQFDFTGLADLSTFLEAAAAAGLRAIVRPGPYICAEWDNGGLPAWLTGRPDIRLRCMDEAYLAAVDQWFDELIPRIAAHQVTRGGNVTMVQVENEYGSYGSDAAYLAHLRDGLIRRGIDVPLFTSDGPDDFHLTGGTTPGVLATVNFGSDPEGAFASLRSLRPDDAQVCMEFWNGWFDHWGQSHHTRDADDAADVLARILSSGASVNLYMAHGGTNFGTWAGANRFGDGHDGDYLPTVTSYDYDAPIDERGTATEKFWQFRKVLECYADEPLPQPPAASPLLAPVEVSLAESTLLFDALRVLSGEAVSAPTPPTFEELGLTHGLVLYRTSLPGPRAAYPLAVDGLADRAHLFVDGKLHAVLDQTKCAVDIDVPGTARVIDLLVESMGRTNYGPRLGERKGITGGVRHERQYVHGFTAYPLDINNLAAVPWGRTARACSADTTLPDGGPVFRRGWLDVGEVGDAFLALPGFSKGYAWVNGFCLGRYWNTGPQHSLYLPWPLLRQGRNEILVLDLDGALASTVQIRSEPDLG